MEVPYCDIITVVGRDPLDDETARDRIVSASQDGLSVTCLKSVALRQCSVPTWCQTRVWTDRFVNSGHSKAPFLVDVQLACCCGRDVVRPQTSVSQIAVKLEDSRRCES